MRTATSILLARVTMAVGLLLPSLAIAQVKEEMVAAQPLSAAAAASALSPLTLSRANSTVHIFPTLEHAATLRAALAPAAPTPLVYHGGGPIMPVANIYLIFWVPQKLQNGGATSISPSYQALQARLMTDYVAHGIDNNNTQYYQIISGSTKYIANAGSFGGSYTDTSAYPASGCNDTVTVGNCLTDSQIQAEVKKIVNQKKWPSGLNNIYFLYTSSGEGSCFDSSSSSCAYTQYCAYHGAISGSSPIIYANMPYGDPTRCQTSGTPSPNGDPIADTAATAASHELTEAITDPMLNAWFTSSGAEIGDLCAYQYGTNSWDTNKANQMWNGNFYELQEEYNNHVNGCSLVGP